MSYRWVVFFPLCNQLFKFSDNSSNSSFTDKTKITKFNNLKKPYNADKLKHHGIFKSDMFNSQENDDID